MMLDLEQLAESEELFDGHYKLLYPLNTDDATADIWLAVDTNTVDENEADEEQGLKVAIKIYRLQNALDFEGILRFHNEFKVVSNCQQSNLFRPVNSSIYNETPYLVFPYCQNGSTEMITGQMQRDEDIWKFIYDVASGLHYLHTNNPQIIHQDIKPANILIDDNRNYTITDFGISISGQNKWHDIEDHCGTLAYMAPERFVEGVDPMPESDIWAFGATLYELITGNIPFGEDGGRNQMEETPSLNFPKNTCSKGLQRLICTCLRKTPHNRPTAGQLVEFARNKNYLEHKKIGKKYIWTICSILVLFLLIGGLCFVANSSKESTADEVDKSDLSQLEERESAIFLLDGLDEIPSYQGGNEELCKYLSRTIRLWPESEYDKFVTVTIVINRDGTINEGITVKADNPDVRRNMYEVIQGMPKWNSGIRNGKPVPVQVRMSFLLRNIIHFKTNLGAEIYRININD